MTPPTSTTRSVPEATDRQVGALASRQHGVVSREQLTSIGLSRSAIQARCRRGWLRRIHRGVYAVGHSDISQHGRWLAAVLAGGGADAPTPALSTRPHSAHRTVLSHWSAAALHGLLARDRGIPEITSTSSRHERPGIRVHRSRTLESSVATRDGIPCTTVGRTLIDIAGTGNEQAAQRTWSMASSRGLIRRSELERELRAGPNRPGTAFVRRAYAEDFGYLEQRTRSELEREALRFCRDFGIPRPHANRLVHVGAERVEADLLWPQARLIVEIDGDATHSHPAARRADRSRDARLQLAGWRTIRIGQAELVQRPRQTAELIRAALAQPPLIPTSTALPSG